MDSGERAYGERIAAKLVFSSLVDLLSSSPRPAILSSDARSPLSHTDLSAFIKQFDLQTFGLGRNDRIGVILPEGPELGVCLTCVLARATAVPLNEKEIEEEIVSELEQMRAKAAIVCKSRSEDRIVSLLASAGFLVLLLEPSPSTAGLFTLSAVPGSVIISPSPPTVQAYTHPQDCALVLRTSGTSGNKKTVPYTLRTLCIGAMCVAKSWALTEKDVNLNMMPLYHVGGIVRNLLSPLLSGGAVITCKGFDPAIFWDIVEASPISPTWYYAVPTMHHAILQEGRERYSGRSPSRIRMICNAGGGLQPSLAVELRNYFAGAVVLPSYGMTECMPITTPPQDYALDRPGTSGKSVGPEIAIFNASLDVEQPLRVIGNICVRGEPLFGGYEGNQAANDKAFNNAGWFDTGDMGYLDEDGYLYITGRSKEVINRGGEIISPVDIESAVIEHPRIRNALAFSVPHNILQETIGVVIVPESGSTLVDMTELHRFLAESLHPSKWPQVLVYMDDLPKNMNNKPLRINLAKRLGIPELQDGTSQFGRMYEAVAPPRTASLSDPIPAQRIKPNGSKLVHYLLRHDGIADAVALTGFSKSDPEALVAFVATWSSHNLRSDTLYEYLDTQGRIHDYERPREIIVLSQLPRHHDGSLDIDVLSTRFAEASANSDDMSHLEKGIGRLFVDVLNVQDVTSRDADFFELGGDSLKAGRLVHMIRKRLDVNIPASNILRYRSVASLASAIAERLPSDSPWLRSESVISSSASDLSGSTAHDSGDEADDAPRPESSAKSPLSISALFIQVLPILILRPLRITCRWIFFAYVLIWTHPAFRVGGAMDSSWLHPVQLMLALVIAQVVLWVFLPILGIALKWLVIGKYKAGSYPLWGSYYLRWWFVDQAVQLCGRGFFAVNNATMRWYLRCMGARVGSNSQIDLKTSFGEYDLIQIGENCGFESARVRPFTMQTGRMVLGPIVIGHNSVVNIKTTIAPGAMLPNNIVLPPLSSSYEMDDASEEYRGLCRTTGPTGPHLVIQLLLGWPVIFIVNLFGMIPWLGVIYLMSAQKFFIRSTSAFEFGDVLHYFAAPARIGYHVLALIMRDTVSPFLYLAACILFKRLIIGKFKAGPRDLSQLGLLRYWLMQKLLGDGTLGGVNALLGSHYEFTSMIYRSLGAKIGKRVYWPGTGLFVFEHDLMEVGDDVVFGSRSFLVCSDHSESAPIKIGAGAMIADRCVLLPGVTIGRNAIMGSGGLARKGTHYPAGSIWLGSANGGATLWDMGNEREAEKAPTDTPFGRAFYEKKASFTVLPMWFCAAYNIVISIFTSTYWSLPVLAAIQVGNLFYVTGKHPKLFDQISPTWVSISTYCAMFLTVSVGFTVLAFGALGIEIAAKWSLFGRRAVGKYNWDDSSYCQRWQVYIAMLRVRRDILDYIRGSWYILQFFRFLGCRIGKRVCLYPTGGDPMMTEPDLITIGDDAAVDNASVVCHLNSKGQFSLNPLVIGAGSVLRANSRLLSGAHMEEDATLLEHTLIVSGDVVESHSVCQGWPSMDVTNDRSRTFAQYGSVKKRKPKWRRKIRGFFGVFRSKNSQNRLMDAAPLVLANTGRWTPPANESGKDTDNMHSTLSV
ncbi:hypothetical protein SpCBS45565_g02004 [Spizellomyces sp. 'palustris']|nr:hypothetical protein SpCBS45565_g02004 [Spizellomyces sp. 'palustris']